MRRWLALVAVVLGVVAMSRPLAAQAQGARAAGKQTDRPASQPAPADGAFTSRLVFVPRSPDDVRHVRVPFDPLIQPGILGFPTFRRYSSMQAGTYAAPVVPPAEGGPAGGLQLDVEPRRAQVYVDGAYVGLVDEFSGYFHHLDLVAGPHVIEILAPDYQPLITDVIVSPGHTTTYRAALTRAEGR
jgi:hypothetical protein